jgi:5-deoxy-glucuronate isomerase
MNDLIRAFNNKNKSIVTEENELLDLTYFNILKLDKGETFDTALAGFESVYVVLQGNCDILVGDQSFTDVGQRKDIWSGKADSIYIPVGSTVKVISNMNDTEIAVAGGKCDREYEPFRITPQDVEMVDVGSSETKTHRRIFHILGKNADGRAGNLLVSELYAEEGCWSGYPPHKHDEEKGEKETEFEELYHFRFNPANGFGAQFAFQDDGSSIVYMTRSGDTFLLKKGYHPTVTSPGHEEYIFTIIVGKYQRSLVQYFKDEYQHLMTKFPGVKDMIDKFK